MSRCRTLPQAEYSASSTAHAIEVCIEWLQSRAMHQPNLLGASTSTRRELLETLATHCRAGRSSALDDIKDHHVVSFLSVSYRAYLLCPANTL